MSANCAECARLEREREAARRAGDMSKATDCAVRHGHAAPGPEPSALPTGHPPRTAPPDAGAPAGGALWRGRGGSPGRLF